MISLTRLPALAFRHKVVYVRDQLFKFLTSWVNFLSQGKITVLSNYDFYNTRNLHWKSAKIMYNMDRIIWFRIHFQIKFRDLKLHYWCMRAYRTNKNFIMVAQDFWKIRLCPSAESTTTRIFILLNSQMWNETLTRLIHDLLTSV